MFELLPIQLVGSIVTRCASKRYRDGTVTKIHVKLANHAAERLPIAEAMRAAAIMLVVTNHLALHAHPMIGHRILTLGYFGVWGVNCFFVLTGLLLSPPFLRAVILAGPPPGARDFYTRRFFRIYPLYFVAVAASAIIVLVSSGYVPTWRTIIAHVLMLHGFSTATITDLNSPLWTMPIDVAFYVALPAVAFTLTRFPGSRSRAARIRLVGVCLLAAIAASITFRYVTFRHHPLAASDFKLAAVYIRNIFGMTASFSLGVTLALLIELKIRLRERAALGVLVVGIVIAAIELFGRFEESATPLTLTLLDPLAAVSSTCFLAAALLREGSTLLGPATRKAVAGAAAIAYAVYLFHWPILDALQQHVPTTRAGVSAFGELALLLAVCVIPLAYVAHRFIEKPFLALNERNRSRAQLSTPEAVTGESVSRAYVGRS